MIASRQFGRQRVATPPRVVGKLARGSVTPERLALAAEAARLRNDEHLTWREIAERLGISRSYAETLRSDPDGAKARARKDRYRGTCVDCGGPTTGSEGPSKTPDRCHSCAALMSHAERYWTADRILNSFRRFANVNGRAPTATDRMITNPSIRAKVSPERLADAERAMANCPDLPHPYSVQREFGTWATAVKAAGLTPGPSGGAGHRAPRRRSKGDTLARIYHVLHRNGDGGFHDQTVEAYSPENAIEKVADGEGEWVAILDSNWFAASVEPRQIFAVVKP